MRITNKIMQNNSLRNINRNKETQDTLNTQMATGNKVIRPSDDPVVAIRSLRLNNNLTKLDQYNKKNAEDAGSWLSVTEDAISTVSDILLDMYHQCEKGAGDDMNTTNYKAILDELKSFRDEIYACGDADYAGRNLFTGYRTDSNLTFQQNTDMHYIIEQTFSLDDFEEYKQIDTKDILKYDPDAGFTANEQGVETIEFKRLRLDYDNLMRFDDPNLKEIMPKVYVKDAEGNMTEVPYACTSYSYSGGLFGTENIYKTTSATVLSDTGEFILNDAAVNSMKSALNAAGDGAQLVIVYEKSEWSKGDLKPEHYYDCTTIDADGVETEYASGSSQEIYYDLGSNQTLRVNTAADEVFNHDIGRDVDDLDNLVGKLDSLDQIVADLEKKTDELSGTALAKAKDELAAAKKAQTLVKDQVQKLFGKCITTMQNYQDQANLAVTGIGTRDSRLHLVMNRLDSQTDTFTELLTKNSKKEIEETATELASAGLAYEAALSATSKILQTNLMNYI